ASLTIQEQMGAAARVIVITSPAPGGGKTTIVSNLGIAMADAGKRVLIIDTDLRKPRLDELFGVKGESGFSNLITSKSKHIDELSAGVKATEVPGLYILPSGCADLNLAG